MGVGQSTLGTDGPTVGQGAQPGAFHGHVADRLGHAVVGHDLSSAEGPWALCPIRPRRLTSPRQLHRDVQASHAPPTITPTTPDTTEPTASSITPSTSKVDEPSKCSIVTQSTAT